MTNAEIIKMLYESDNSTICTTCGQPLFLEDCTPEQCNCREQANGREDVCDNFRPRDMGRLDWNVLDFYRWQREVE